MRTFKQKKNRKMSTSLMYHCFGLTEQEYLKTG